MLFFKGYLVSFEDVAGVDFIFHIIQAAVVAVGYDGLAATFELLQVVDHLAAKEGGATLQGGFVDDDGCPFGLYPLHYTLYGALAEVVTVALHG